MRHKNKSILYSIYASTRTAIKTQQPFTNLTYSELFKEKIMQASVSENAVFIKNTEKN